MNNKLRQKGWADMSQRLDVSLPRDRKPIFAIWWVWGLAILIGLGAWYMYTQQAQPTAASGPSDIAQTVPPQQQTPDQSPGTGGDLDNPHLAGASPSSTSEEMPFTSSRTVVPKAVSSAPPANTDIPAPSAAADVHAKVNKARSQALLDTTANELGSEPSGVQEPNKSGRIFTQAAQLPQHPFSNPFALSQPEHDGLYPIEASNPTAFTERVLESGSRYFIDLAAGIRTARPYSYAGQAGMGWRAPLSGKWSYGVTLGVGVDGLHQTADIALKERQTSSRSQDENATSGSTGDVSNNFSESGEFGVAQLDLQDNYFAYFGLHMTYNFASNWSLRLGVETAYRFHIATGESYVYSSISAGQFSWDNSLSRIEEQFVVFNRWDLRPVAGLSYALRPDIHLNLTYRHGTHPLLQNPIQDTPAGRARFLQLGIQFDL
jgi:hypothetical protein